MEENLEVKIEGNQSNRPKDNLFVKIWRFYYDGFRNMTIGRYLWIIILAKLAIMFLVFKLFFFPNILSRDYNTDEERSQAVREHLIDRKQ